MVTIGVLGTLCVLGVVFLPGTLAETLGSPLKVAHCRAKCLNAFWNESDASTCLQISSCQNCWNQCQLLGNGWSESCGQIPQCDAGCLLACRFHLQQEVQRSPVLVTRGQEVILVSGDFASWPPPPPPSGMVVAPHVFVVMCRLTDYSWTQVTQTVDLSVRLPGPHACTTVRVMVVGVDGLVTVYSPASRPRQQDADVIMRSLGRELWTPPQDNRTDQDNDVVEEGWRMREVSLIHQGVLVIAEVSWEPRGVQGTEGAQSLYLVTWELEGGGLKGNLLTDSTCVTLSLWPDTVYRIQVQLFRDAQSVSEPLVLDTRQATPLSVPPAPHSHPVYGHPGFEGVAGVAAALLLFLLVLLLISGRSRGQEVKVQKSDERTCDRFKLFPPPVRLLLDSAPLPDVPMTSSKSAVQQKCSEPSSQDHLVDQNQQTSSFVV
ncbi:uncharacterized protein LOC128987082 [Macrosteles quadrilineatus]|uniref:uncharacterized protein LOC128987082 n=1 Tax=Macrosteles quadrilineatus TaxID=74068 RepID=UPI0023E0ED8E|nr:uncharacterized protein LOC128987082 [Macrosteles quadrilineatus]